MIASLPMYDWPELRRETDALWSHLARHLGIPLELTRAADYAASWRDPALFFSQTCGYPFTHAFRNRLTYVATPHYRADGCAGAGYRSIVFARAPLPLAALRGAVAAVNNADSMSGMLALKLVFAPLAANGRFFSRTIASGSHVASLLAVRGGRADVCAIDAVCVALARRYRPDALEGLHEIARSPPVPALPFVTICGDAGRLRRGLADFCADPAAAASREALLLAGIEVLPDGAYDAILALESEVERAGGLALL